MAATSGERTTAMSRCLGDPAVLAMFAPLTTGCSGTNSPSRDEVVDGALCRRHAQLPALSLIAISLSGRVARVQPAAAGWTLPIIAVGLWAFVAMCGRHLPGVRATVPGRAQRDESRGRIHAAQYRRDREALGSTRPMSPRRRSLPDRCHGRRTSRERHDRSQHPVLDGRDPSDVRAVRGAATSRFEVPWSTSAPSRRRSHRSYLINGEPRRSCSAPANSTRRPQLGAEHVRLTGYGLALLARTPPHLRQPERLPVVCRSRPIRHSLQLDQPQIYTVKAGTPSSAPRSTKSTMSTARPIRTFRFATTATGVGMGSFIGGCVAMRFGQIEPLISNFVSTTPA